MRNRVLLSVAAAALALVAIVAPWRALKGAAQSDMMSERPLDQLTGDDFDRAFLAQMTMHHAMAVMMTRPMVANAAYPELRQFGEGIIADQAREIAQMRTWARDWYGLDLPDHVAMMDAMQPGGMPMSSDQSGGHAGHGGMMAKPGGMPGMGQMCSMQGMQMGEMSMMADLWKLPANRLEVVFMSLMIPHHQGAVDMATLASERAGHQEIKDLGRAIVNSQAAEIGTLNGWLASWYGL